MEEAVSIQFSKPLAISAGDIVHARFDVGLGGVTLIEVRLNDQDITDIVSIAD